MCKCLSLYISAILPHSSSCLYTDKRQDLSPIKHSNVKLYTDDNYGNFVRVSKVFPNEYLPEEDFTKQK